MRASARSPVRPTEFDVWGCRGSRSLVPHCSDIGNYTSCYSVLHDEDLFVLDAGRGLAALARALFEKARFARVRRVHILLSHAHMDHWEGIKDAEWFWERSNRVEVEILGTAEALGAVRTGYSHPLYVALELLAKRTVKGLKWRMLRAGDRKRIAGFSVRTGPLFHYSGEGRSYRVLDAIGFRLTTPDGASIAYLCDHEPRPGTAAAERALVEGVQLAVYDAHFPNVRDHMHGHGSQEHAARMARDYPGALVLAGHHGPAFSDRQIKVAYRRHRKGTPNFELAVEGDTYRFDRRRGSFVKRKSAGR
ncbi:MAG TPA: MBL fold metallo-hydrolase [Vicinamibacteria bacterium]|nr:MBL fold metallo-hydrolase [Vicinamibacteria bacterium]